MQEIVVPIVQTSNCRGRMNQTEGVDENLIVCTGGAAKGPCKGDSGGPLTITNKEGAHILVGIVSKRL